MVPYKNFSFKLAFVGAIVGASVGLGMINLNLCFNFAIAGALIFGYKGFNRPSVEGDL